MLKIARRKTHVEFIEEVKNMYGDEYIVLGKYINSKAKILMRHNSKGCNYHTYMVTPNHFIKGRKCPVCAIKITSDKRRKTQEEFEHQVQTVGNGEYEVIGKYINTNTKVPLRHLVCGEIWEVRPSSFLHKRYNCPTCSGKRQKNTQIFKQEIYEIVGDEYTVLGEYVNTHTHITMRHNDASCNYHTWDVEPNSFLNNGRRCPVCSYKNSGLKNRKTHEEFVQEVHELTGGEFSVLGTYQGNKKKVLMRHNNSSCGNYEFTMRPNSFLRGYRCPKCYSSKGEQAVSTILDKLDLSYKIEYRITECRNKCPLPFDFAVFDESNRLMRLIEYDGELHYHESGFKNSKKKLKEYQINDEIKNRYCKENNISLLRIPYWEFDNIEKILHKEFRGE